MLHLLPADRAYDPATIDLMAAAFDIVCLNASKRIRNDDGVRQRLALIVLRLVDQGERDPVRLAGLAFCDLDRSAEQAGGAANTMFPRAQAPTRTEA